MCIHVHRTIPYTNKRFLYIVGDIEKTHEISGSDLMLELFVPDTQPLTDLPGMVWHFLDGHGGGLSLLAAMKIAQGEVQRI